MRFFRDTVLPRQNQLGGVIRHHLLSTAGTSICGRC